MIFQSPWDFPSPPHNPAADGTPPAGCFGAERSPRQRWRRSRATSVPERAVSGEPGSFAVTYGECDCRLRRFSKQPVMLPRHFLSSAAGAPLCRRRIAADRRLVYRASRARMDEIAGRKRVGILNSRPGPPIRPPTRRRPPSVGYFAKAVVIAESRPISLQHVQQIGPLVLMRHEHH